MTYLCSPLTLSILDGIGRGHFQEVVFFFFFYLIMCVHFLGNYTRMQLFGYGVEKNPSPITSPSNHMKILLSGPTEASQKSIHRSERKKQNPGPRPPILKRF